MATSEVYTAFQGVLDACEELRRNMRRLEIELAMADSMVELLIQEVERAQEEAASGKLEAAGWREKFARNWPKGKPRRRWLPWGVR